MHYRLSRKQQRKSCGCNIFALQKETAFSEKTCMYQQEISQEEFWVKKVNVFLFLHAKYANHTAHNLHTAISHLHCNDTFETFKWRKRNCKIRIRYSKILQSKNHHYNFFSFHGRNRLPRTCKKILKQDNCYIIVEATMNNWVGLDTFIQKSVYLMSIFIPGFFSSFFRYKQAHIVSLQWD